MTLTDHFFDQGAIPLFSRKLVQESHAIDRYLAIIPYRQITQLDVKDEAIEQLHQLRVHTRRLRTLIHNLAPAITNKKLNKELKQLRKSYRNLIQPTNVIRDQHVLRQQLAEWAINAGVSQRHACQCLSVYVITESDRINPSTGDPTNYDERIKTTLLGGHSYTYSPNTLPHQSQPDHQALNSTWWHAYHQLNNRLRKKINKKLLKHKDSLTLGCLLNNTITDLQQRADEEINRWKIGDTLAIHELRITIKQLRYLLAPWCSQLSSLNTISPLLKSLQEILGKIHDNHVQQAWLQKVTPQVSRDFYALACKALMEANYNSLVTFYKHHPSPMKGILQILLRLQKESRLLEAWLQEMLDMHFQDTLIDALEYIKDELKKDELKPANQRACTHDKLVDDV